MNLGQGDRVSRGAIPSGLAEEVEEEVAAMAAYAMRAVKYGGGFPSLAVPTL